jgi:hypothetical protein
MGSAAGETIKGMAKKPTIMTKWGPMITDKGFVHHTDRETARCGFRVYVRASVI